MKNWISFLTNRAFSRTGFALVVVTCLLGFWVVGCNTDSNAETHINLPLPESLADTSKVDQITVTLLTADGTVLKSNVFQGKFPENPEHKLKDLNLGQDVPPNYVLQVHAFKNGVEVYTLQVEVSSGIAGQWIESKAKPNLIRIQPQTPTLTVGGPVQQLTISRDPIDADARVIWKIGDTTKANLSNDGIATPIAIGTTWIKAISIADPTKTDSVMVTILPEDTDTLPPIVNAPTGVIANPKQLKMAIEGGDKILTATVLPLDAPDAVIWKSLNDVVAQVNNSGIVTPIALGEAKIVVQVASNALLTDTVLVSVLIPQTVTSLKFNRPLPVIYTGAAPVLLGLAVIPSTSVPIVNWLSNDTGVVQITADGKLKGIHAGVAQIQVSAVGSLGAGDTATITVKKDVPQIDAGKDQDIPLGGTATFTIVITQEFGTIQELTWDLNGDGTPEGTSTKDSVLTTFSYPVAGTYNAVFTVIDGEGNSNSITRRIRVGSLAPHIEITKPLKHAYVRTTPFVVEYLVDNIPKTQSFDLIEGINPLVVKASNPEASDSVSVFVTLDTQAPVVKILSPAANYVTNKNSIPVAWTVDLVNQTLGTTETPTIANGAWTIKRSFSDSAGNVGMDSVQIILDTIPPGPPVFVGGDTTTNNKLPTWSWNSGLGGNGTFSIQFGTLPEQEVTTKSYQPTTDLLDGPYSLKIRERDIAGNWSTWVTKTITVKTSGPGAPSFDLTKTTASPTNLPRPTWTWVSGTGGSGLFRWSLNTTPVTAGEDASKTFTPTTNLADGSYTMTVSERDAVGNWSTPVTRDIVIQTSGPVAPRVTGSAILTKTTPTWSWTGTGRVGAKFRVRLFKAGGTTYTDSIETTASTYAPAATLFANSDDIAYTVKVKEQDALGNWGGDGNADVRVDNVAPGKPAFTVQPATPVNAADTRTSLTWTWGRTGAPTDSFVVLMNTSQVSRQTSTTYNLSTFPPGSYALEVIEFDLAGNSSPNSAGTIVVVDKTPPNSPTGVTTTSPTTSPTPTFTWTSGGGGNGTYRVRMDNSDLTTGTTTVTTTSYKPTLTEGNHTLYVQERDDAGNWSNNPPAQGTVLVDLNPPTVSKPVNQTIATTSTTVSFTATDGSGSGVKSAVCKWGTSSSANATLSGANWTCSISNLPKGATTVTLEATDNVNKTGSNSLTVTVNIPITQITVDIKYQHYPTNLNSIKVPFTAGTAARDTTFNLTPGPNTFTILGPVNGLGERDSEPVTIYYLNTVIFVAGGGTGNGSTWDSPLGQISAAITAAGSKSGSVQIWVAPGTFLNFSLDRGNTSILGGFKLSDYPFVSTARDPAANISYINPPDYTAFAGFTGSNIVFDGFHVTGQTGASETSMSIFEVTNSTFKNIWVENSAQGGNYGMITIYHSNVNLESIFIRNNTMEWNVPLFIYGGSIVSVTKSDISNNVANGRSGSAGIYSEESDVTIRYSHLNQNGKLGETTYNGAAANEYMDIDYCNVLYGRSSFYPDIDSDPTGAIIRWGSNNCDYGARSCTSRF